MWTQATVEEFQGKGILGPRSLSPWPAMTNPISAFLDSAGVLILDGGLATELEYQGADLDGPLWSARVLLEEPERVSQVHEAYLRAGADCIVSATYQATFQGLAERGLDRDAAADLMLRSVELALEARDRVWADLGSTGRRRPLVAASIGPYGAYLADGSEYRGDYGLGIEDLVDFHRPRLELLAGSEADLLAFETIPSFDEALAVRSLLDSARSTPAWVAFSCRDGATLCDGTPIEQAVAAVESSERVLAVGVNCTAPRRIQPLLERAASATTKPLIAYPNSGEGWDAAAKRWLSAGETGRPVDHCRDWRSSGALLIGGCCRTRPEDIAALRRALLDG